MPLALRRGQLYNALLDQSLYQYEDDQQRQHELQVALEQLVVGEAHALAGIDFSNVLVVTPTPLVHAEQQVYQRADRQQQVADQEVLGIEHVPAVDQAETTPDVVAEYAGQAGDQHERHVDDHGPLARPVEVIDAVGNQVFKHGDDRGKAGEGHEQEVQIPGR